MRASPWSQQRFQICLRYMLRSRLAPDLSTVQYLDGLVDRYS